METTSRVLDKAKESFDLHKYIIIRQNRGSLLSTENGKIRIIEVAK